MIELEAKSVRFFSERDEVFFFTWIDQIPAVSKAYGEGCSIFLCVEEVDDESLRELIALFYRYEVKNLAQLAQFKTDANLSWFFCDEMYWFDEVFRMKK